MDLWIRSQDKMILEKVERIKIVDRYDEMNKQSWYELHCKFENTLNASYERMAMYKTKERALEVLDEIQKYLEKMGTDEILTDKVGILNGIKHYGIVYKMPES